MNENREEILRVTNLKQHFKSGSGRNKLVVKAVDGVSFSIYKGEVFSLVGESGCGKTTTGRSIIKLYQSTAGEVIFHGTRIISDVGAAKKKYHGLLRIIKRERKDLVSDLKEKLAGERISQDEYQKELEKFDYSYEELIENTYNEVRLAKRDQNFERIISMSGAEIKRNLQTFPEYQSIIAFYEEENKKNSLEITRLGKEIATLKANLDSSSEAKEEEKNKAEQEKIHLLAKQLKKAEKEIRLNAVRQKHDIHKFIYQLKYKNRLLMRKMQMIFQDPIASLNPRMTVKEIIAEGLRINGVKNEVEIDNRVKEALKVVGLVPEHASRYPHEFSGGQRQRIGIARALVVEPSFIIADEPISALDVSIRAQIINLLNDLRETKGITILFIAHDLSVVKYFSNRLAVMYYGHIVEMGDKEKIFDHPLHPYTLSLMDSIPLPDPEYEKRRTKTSLYDPSKYHDYSKEAPTLREVEPGHLVLCNTEEYNRYMEKINKR